MSLCSWVFSYLLGDALTLPLDKGDFLSGLNV